MVVEYTLDQRIENLTPEIDLVLRTELCSILGMLRHQRYPTGVMGSMSRLCLILLDLVLASAGSSRPGDNLCSCIGHVEGLTAPSGKKVVPNEIASILHTVRILSNKSDHAAESSSFTTAEAEGTLAMFLRVVQWFYVECETGPKLPQLTTLPIGNSAVSDKAVAQLPESMPLYRVLPSPPSTFIGRAEELERLNQLLAETRLLTLIGSGGCGKTRLAIQIASDEDLSHTEICFVDLTAAISAEDVSSALAQALATEQVPGAMGTERIVQLIGRRDFLLVIDNCEQVVTDIASVVWTLLNRCSRLRVLATSRQPLDINGEVTYRVPSLRTPESVDIPVDTLVQYDAVKLFIARAKSVEPTFAVTNETAPAVADICSRLDGVPLALELAAARIRSLTPQEIRDRLQKTFGIVMGSGNTVIRRHQTLRATLEWSYNLLTSDEQVLFRRLSVFHGGFRLRHAESICHLDPLESESVAPLLENLIDKSLVSTEKLASTMRYKLLETVREYASLLLRSTPEYESHAEHAAATFAQEASALAGSVRSSDQASVFNDLEPERWNHAYSISHLCSIGQSHRAAEGVLGIWRYWYTRGYYDDGITICEEVCKALPDDATDYRARLYRVLSLLCVSASYDERAINYASQNVEMRRKMGDTFDLAEALVNRAVVYVRMDRFADASDDATESQPMLDALGASRASWANLHTLGTVCLNRGQYNDAARFFASSRDGWQSVGDLRGVAKGLDGLFACSIAADDRAEAVKTGIVLGTLWQDLRHVQGTVTFLSRCSLLAAKLGDDEVSRRLARGCSEYCRTHGVPLADEDIRTMEVQSALLLAREGAECEEHALRYLTPESDCLELACEYLRNIKVID